MIRRKKRFFDWCKKVIASNGEISTKQNSSGRARIVPCFTVCRSGLVDSDMFLCL